MTKYDSEFRVYRMDTRPQWSTKHRTVILHPPGTTPYYGMEMDIADWDSGYGDADKDGKYIVIDIPDEFDAELVPYRFEGGRSAANIRFKDLHRGYTYLWPANAAVEAIAATEHSGGLVRGTFKLVKKGANIRLKMKSQFDTLEDI